jgi:uncharacterized protein (DUF488 family)
VLIRQKTLLSLLARADRPLTPTVFVKLVFLLRHETGLQKDRSFYDFVPYNFGPFSFTLYRELGSLRQNGYVTPAEDQIALCAAARNLAKEQAEHLPSFIRAAVADVLNRYGRMNQNDLIRYVYNRYPWFALKSKRREGAAMSVERPREARPAVYTVGYEGRSVDAFLNDLLKRGIHVVVDVRANPVSRKYGFSGLRLGELCEKVGLKYRHVPALGIPSTERAGLGDFESYQRLLTRYEQAMLPKRVAEVEHVGRLMREHASVLVCVEKDVRCCHRSRLAHAIAGVTGLEVIHL